MPASIQIRKTKEEETGNEDDKQALDDIGYHNEDLYISIQVVAQD